MKKKGVCYICGCTDDAACPEGCSWANRKQTLCSACVDLSEDKRAKKRAAALIELQQRYGSLIALAREVEDCIEVLRSETKPAPEKKARNKRSQRQQPVYPRGMPSSE